MCKEACKGQASFQSTQAGAERNRALKGRGKEEKKKASAFCVDFVGLKRDNADHSKPLGVPDFHDMPERILSTTRTQQGMQRRADLVPLHEIFAYSCGWTIDIDDV